MKRLISWLLALTMIMALLPMSAFAAETDVEIGGEDSDFDVEFGGELNPIDLTTDLKADMTATVTIPAGKTFSYIANGIGGMVMTINGEDKGVCEAAPRQPYAWTITNDGAEAAEYVIVVSYPLGHQMNPVVIEDMTWYSSEVSQAAGDNDGYFYTYTATETGTVTLYFNAVYDENDELVENVGIRDIMVTNQNTYAQYSLQQDGVDNYGLELVVPVAAGQTLLINTAWVTDVEGNYYPEATYSWTGNFAYPAGSEQNPIAIEWTWNDEGTTATATVEVAADDTYYVGQAGMILTANGEEIAQDAAGNFVLDAGTYELKLATPVGAYNNPEVIENIDGYTDSNSLEADANYNYVWTATEDGTVTLDITDGANITVNKVIEISEDGWPVTEQFELATVEYDDNWNASWVVAENLVIEVVAGQQLNIQVNGLTDWDTWSVPAIDYTLTGSFEKAVTGPVDAPDLKFQTYALSFQEDISIQFVLRTTVANQYDSVTVECIHEDPVDGTLTENLVGTAKGSAAIQYKKNMKSWSMPDMVTITLYAEKDGVTYKGQSVTTSIELLALDLLAKYSVNASQEKFCPTLVNMLNYGAAVQIAYNHNAADPADAGEYAHYATTEEPVINATNTKTDAGAVRVIRHAIAMSSQVQLQTIFAGDVTGYELRYTVDGVTTTIPGTEFAKFGSNYQGIVAVKAANMRKVYNIGLYDPATGEAVSAIYTSSVEGFATEQLNGQYRDVIVTMMKYGDSVASLL